jgi:hypothetical protein
MLPKVPLTRVTLYRNNLAFFEHESNLGLGKFDEVAQTRSFRLDVPLELKDLVCIHYI